MRNRNLILVPTRGRPQNAIEVLASHKQFSCKSDLLFIVDLDDPMRKEYIEAVSQERIELTRTQTRGMAQPLNVVARLYSTKGYEFFTFIGDDHRPQTPDWDVRLANALGDKPGIAYGNDLLQGERLPTAVLMSAAIVTALGGMVPPKLRHLYLDNFWLRLGKDLGNLKYLPDVIVEHRHPLAGKAEWDQGYREVNSNELYNFDALMFDNYIKSEDYSILLKKLRG